MRKWVGYSATELAEITGYSKSIISRWENEKQNLAKDSDRLLRLVVFAEFIEDIAGEAKGVPKKLADVARLVKSLSLAEILRHIEDRYEGSKPVRIDPSAADPCLAIQ